MEGCIMVVVSDNSVWFYEVWGWDDKVVIMGGVGMLGGSDILEGFEGIDKEGDVICWLFGVECYCLGEYLDIKYIRFCCIRGWF